MTGVMSFDELQLKAKVFYEKHIKIYVRRFNSGRVEHINGYITESPSADFFFLSDLQELDKHPKLIFFIELQEKDAMFRESLK
jgi:hypothetical protein